LENGREYVLFFIGMMLDVWNAFISSKNPLSDVSLENVKESNLILMEFFFDRSKKNKQRPILFVYGTAQNAFCSVEERFLNREESIP
jgi:hypothetical protein